MIKIINAELFRIISTKESNESGEFFKTTFSTSFDVKNAKTGKMSPRVITTAISTEEDPSEGNVNIHTSVNKLGHRRVSLRTNERNKHDMNVYLIAIPFNGFIQEIEKSFGYRIYRGLVIHSDRKNIEFDGETYKKVAYMMVVANEGMFDESHKYHADEIDLVVNTFNLETDPNSQENYTVKTTNTISFTNDGACFERKAETVDPINPDDFKNKMVFPIFKDTHVKKSGNTNTGNRENKPHVVRDLDSMIDKFNKDCKDNQKSAYNNNKNKGKRKRK